MSTRLRILGAHATVRDALRALGLQERFGHMGRSATVSDVVEEFRRGSARERDGRA